MAFVDQGEFEAMKTLNGWEAAHSDEHQFHAKIKVGTLAIFKLSLLDNSLVPRSRPAFRRFQYGKAGEGLE